jgi:hypothetical protein
MFELNKDTSITFTFVEANGLALCDKCCFDVGAELESLCPEIACTHDTRKDHKDGYYICRETT